MLENRMNFQENKEQKRICPGCGKRLPMGIEVHTGDLINDEPAPEPERSNKPKMTDNKELRELEAENEKLNTKLIEVSNKLIEVSNKLIDCSVKFAKAKEKKK